MFCKRCTGFIFKVTFAHKRRKTRVNFFMTFGLFSSLRNILIAETTVFSQMGYFWHQKKKSQVLCWFLVKNFFEFPIPTWYIFTFWYAVGSSQFNLKWVFFRFLWDFYVQKYSLEFIRWFLYFLPWACVEILIFCPIWVLLSDTLAPLHPLSSPDKGFVLVF